MTKTQLACGLLLASIVPACLAAGFFDNSSTSEPAFLAADEAFVVDALALDGQTLQARWLIAPGYYLYKQRLSVQITAPDGLRADWQAPTGESYHDEHFGDVEIYHDELDLPIQLVDLETASDRSSAPSDNTAKTVHLTLRYQGCAEAGLCYPPQTREFDLPLPQKLKPKAKP